MSHKKIAVVRRLRILASPTCHPRQKGMIKREFLSGKLGILSIQDWYALYQSFSSHQSKKEILTCVRINFQKGSLLGKDLLGIAPYKRFIARVFS